MCVYPGSYVICNSQKGCSSLNLNLKFRQIYAVFLRFLRFNCEELTLVRFCSAGFSTMLPNISVQQAWKFKCNEHCIGAQSCLGFMILKVLLLALSETLYVIQTLNIHHLGKSYSFFTTSHYKNKLFMQNEWFFIFILLLIIIKTHVVNSQTFS